MVIDKKKLSIKHTISIEEFLHLRKQVGFQPLSIEQAELVLKNTSYISAVQYGGEIIGVTRLLFDFCTDAYITDVIVSPDYQGYGVGTMLVNDIINFIKANVSKDTKIACSIYANKGKEKFYKQFGFEELPNNKYGFGMLLEV
ncbi:MAG: GNAT family N-acetyltransferase [Lachnospiraceae bacterium]|nr:GNAT family N-acetyltransferase [Lachnospiraceae bacterium]